MGPFTEKDFDNAILDRMRSGHIRACQIYSAVYEIEFWVRRAYGDKRGTEVLNTWFNNYLEPMFPVGGKVDRNTMFVRKKDHKVWTQD